MLAKDTDTPNKQTLSLQEQIRELETLEQIEYEVTTVNPKWNHENRA